MHQQSTGSNLKQDMKQEKKSRIDDINLDLLRYDDKISSMLAPCTFCCPDDTTSAARAVIISNNRIKNRFLILFKTVKGGYAHD